MRKFTLFVFTLAALCHAADDAEPGVVLVKFRTTANADDIRRVETAHGLTLRKEIKLFRIRTYTYEGDEAPLAKSARIATDPAVEVAEPNWVRTLKAVDPEYSKQWYLKNTGQSVDGYSGPSGYDIRWEAARQRFVERGKVRVAVIDSGVALTHKDVTGSVHTKISETIGDYDNGVDNDGNGLVDDVWGYDWYDLDSVPLDQHGHGTQVAGVIGATIGNGEGGAGITNSVEIRSYRVFNQFGRGGLPKARIGSSYITDVLFAVALAVGDGCKVINMSLGGTSYSSLEASVYADLVGYGVIAVVAAGNESSDNDGATPSYPASYPSAAIISVAAQDRTGGLAGFSCWGRTSVDLAAPGTQIRAPDVCRITVASYDFANGMSGWTSFRYPGTDYSYNTWMATGGFLWDRDWTGQSTYWTNTDTFAQSPIIYASTYSGLRVEAVGSFDLADDFVTLDLTGDDVFWYTYFTLSGSDSGAIQVDISDYDYSNFRLRLRLQSDYSIQGWGIAVRGLRVTAVDDFDFDNPQYTYTQGTSFSAPIVAGVVAMVWAHRPELTAAQVRDIVLTTTRPVAALSGKVATGGMVDADAALAKADLITGNVVPQMVTNPAGGVYQPGNSVTLSAAATAGLPVTYQWRKNGVAINGATQSTLTLSSITLAQAGSYDVVVSSNAGSVTSSAANIQVQTVLAIVTSPASKLVRSGSAFELEVTVTEGANRAYQWFQNGVLIPGANQSKYEVGSAQLTSAGLYTVQITSGAQSVITSPARVEVVAFTADLPATAAMLPLGKRTLVFKYSGVKPAIVWKKDGVVIAGAVTPTLSVVSGTPGTSATYEATLTTSTGQVKTASCVVTTVVPLAAVVSAPSLVMAGTPLTLSAETSGTGPIALQWLKKGKVIVGATGSSLQIASATSLDASDYSLRLTGPANTWTSPASRVAVVDVTINKAYAPTIVLQPGGTVKLAAKVIGYKGATLAWTRDGVVLPGQIGTSLVVNSAGTYRILVTTPAGVKTAEATVVQAQ